MVVAIDSLFMKLLAGEEDASFVGNFRESLVWGLKNDTGELEDKVSENRQRREGSWCSPAPVSPLP